ncbi:helix-turn-helix domain-containing protein [Streptomyces sp. NPDC007346]|uniref:helix-turn-helix domain-containing protein n=1 Tax=Streptomyces sp. NPDC007346 TaxID=3154682 RepID=UPI00345134AE
MNTTAAALQANVTVATIRTWARNGVIAATKIAGRWVINSVSLARRITIGNRHTRKQAPVALNLNATYTYATPGFTHPTETITTRISTRERNGMTLTSVRGLAPLLINHIEAITDEGDRLHTLSALSMSRIVNSDTERDDLDTTVSTRDNGRLSTTYRGTRSLPVSVVLDLAEQIRNQLAK